MEIGIYIYDSAAAGMIVEELWNLQLNNYKDSFSIQQTPQHCCRTKDCKREMTWGFSCTRSYPATAAHYNNKLKWEMDKICVLQHRYVRYHLKCSFTRKISSQQIQAERANSSSEQLTFSTSSVFFRVHFISLLFASPLCRWKIVIFRFFTFPESFSSSVSVCPRSDALLLISMPQNTKHFQQKRETVKRKMTW